ncbi:MAG: CoA pyrophosphatase [Halopseudomonas sp.]
MTISSIGGAAETDLLGLLEQGVRGRSVRRVLRDLPDAGVLVALTDDRINPEVVLTRRASQLSSHPGEVAFPGGKRDPEDASVLATALRESHEEIGLPPEQVRVIGSLNQVVSKHGFLVTPYLGVISTEVALSPNPDELESLFKVPLRFLLDKQQFQLERLWLDGGEAHMPRYDFQGYVIWGLTAYVLVELLNQGLGADLPLQLRPESV